MDEFSTQIFIIQNLIFQSIHIITIHASYESHLVL